MKKVFLSALVLFSAVLLSAADIDLVKNGKAKFAIVLENSENCIQQMAGRELQTFIKKRTGADVPILKAADKIPAGMIPFYLGLSERTEKLGADQKKIGFDGYFFKSSDKYVVIAGRDNPVTTEPLAGHTFLYGDSKRKIYMFGEKGTLNGVYKFLEKYAKVRFYMPYEIGVIVPQSKDFTIPETAEFKAPSFKKRTFYSFWFSKASDEALYWHHRLCAGGMRNPTNHSFHRMMRYRKTNPEYFALIGGKRDFTNLSTANSFGNLCLTNPETIKAYARDAKSFFDRNPSMDIYPCVPQDGMFKICECEGCQKLYSPHLGENGKFSNAVFHFGAEVAKIIKKTNPGKMIGMAAYERYRVAPEIDLPDNMIVMVCYTRQGMRDPAVKAEVEAAIKSYAAKNVKITVWTYALFNHIPPRRGIPVLYAKMTQENLRFNKKHGVLGEFSQSNYSSGGGDQVPAIGGLSMIHSTHLNDYLRFQLLWDTEFDVDAALEEYYQLFFGPAAPEMKKFWQFAEAKFFERGEPTVYTAGDVKEFQKMLKAALAKAPAGSIYHKRIDLLDKELAPFFKTMLLVRAGTRSVGFPFVKENIPLEYSKDSVWKFARKYRFTKTSGAPAPQHTATDLYALANDKYLALHLVSKEKDMSKLLCKTKVRDNTNVWLDDCYEIFALSPDRKINRHYLINVGGTVADSSRSVDINVADWAWNSKLLLKQKREKGYHTTTVLLPWSDFGKSFAERPELIFQIFRRQTDGNPQSGLYHVLFPSPAFHNYAPEYFGQLNLLPQIDIPNSSFENTGSGNIPVSWRGNGVSRAADAADGKAALELKSGSVYSPYFPVTEMAEYNLFFQTKASAPYAYVMFRDKAGKTIHEPDRPFYFFVGKKDWTWVNCQGRVPAGAVSAGICLRNFKPDKKDGPGTMVDNVKFFGGKTLK